MDHASQLTTPLPATRVLPPARPACARGASFVEVVVAVLVLGLATAAMGSAFTFIHGMQERQTARLAAAELANRLILQYLDDRRMLMPQRNRPIDYGGREYRWAIRVAEVTLVNDPTLAQAISGAVRTRTGPELEDRLERVTVTVWLSESSGGAPRRGMGAPEVSLTRVLDPLNFSRNPDLATTLVTDETGMAEILETLQGRRQGWDDGEAGGGGDR